MDKVYLIETDKPFSCVPGNITRTMYSVDGKYHREDGPAIEWVYGNGEWYGEEWYLNGQKHRLDGPAILWYNGEKQWWVNGDLHREDGPAIIWEDGSKEWWLNDKEYTEKKFNKIINAKV